MLFCSADKSWHLTPTAGITSSGVDCHLFCSVPLVGPPFPVVEARDAGRNYSPRLPWWQMETYLAGRDRILRATLRGEANLWAKMEQVKKKEKLIYFTLIIEEVQSLSSYFIDRSFSSISLNNYVWWKGIPCAYTFKGRLKHCWRNILTAIMMTRFLRAKMCFFLKICKCFEAPD